MCICPCISLCHISGMAGQTMLEFGVWLGTHCHYLAALHMPEEEASARGHVYTPPCHITCMIKPLCARSLMADCSALLDNWIHYIQNDSCTNDQTYNLNDIIHVFFLGFVLTCFHFSHFFVNYLLYFDSFSSVLYSCLFHLLVPWAAAVLSSVWPAVRLWPVWWFQPVLCRHVWSMARLGALLLGLCGHGRDPSDAGLLARPGGAARLVGPPSVEPPGRPARRGRRQYVSLKLLENVLPVVLVQVSVT